jgi:lysophospholipid acyltransferase (LPLAT)-like uncharacterized protein
VKNSEFVNDDQPPSLRGMIVRVGLRLLSATWRVRESVPDDCRDIIEREAHGIIAFWHGKMFPVWYRFRRRNYSALISASRDGELLAGYLSRSLGYTEVIRGSSSKGGSRALAEMAEVLESRTLLITPDGPRGPARSAKPGVLIAATRAAVPVVLAGWSCRWRVTLRSWDSMEIPYPFSKINFRYCRFDDSMDTSGWIDDDLLHRFDETLNRLNDRSENESRGRT